MISLVELNKAFLVNSKSYSLDLLKISSSTNYRSPKRHVLAMTSLLIVHFSITRERWKSGVTFRVFKGDIFRGIRDSIIGDGVV